MDKFTQNWSGNKWVKMFSCLILCRLMGWGIGDHLEVGDLLGLQGGGEERWEKILKYC